MANKSSTQEKHGSNSATANGVTVQRIVDLVVIDGKVVPDPTQTGVRR